MKCHGQTQLAQNIQVQLGVTIRNLTGIFLKAYIQLPVQRFNLPMLSDDTIQMGGCAKKRSYVVRCLLCFLSIAYHVSHDRHKTAQTRPLVRSIIPAFRSASDNTFDAQYVHDPHCPQPRPANPLPDERSDYSCRSTKSRTNQVDSSSPEGRSSICRATQDRCFIFILKPSSSNKLLFLDGSTIPGFWCNSDAKTFFLSDNIIRLGLPPVA